jgi:crotonobetainyl-CoA:carnitine CoA-transferase CaiB-like acyl-CoA transferase
MTSTGGPLSGVTVVDLSTVVSGPMASQILADQGAAVIKVEAPPGGDGGRRAGPSRNGMTATFHILNRGKRSILLDLKTAEGREALRRLIARADVLLNNFRPKVMARLGLDYESLRADHPQLIHVSISGFGDEGPLADRPAYDHILQCFGGFAALQARNGEAAPSLVRDIIADKLTALTAAQAITAALVARANGVGGQEVKLSMLGAVLAFLWPDASKGGALLGEGVQTAPTMAEHCRLYAFKNGYATFTPNDRAFAALSQLFGSPTGADPRLATGVGRMQEVELMAQVDREWDAAATRFDVDEIIAVLEALDSPCAKVRSLSELAEHPQVTANGYLRRVEHPVAGPLIEPAPAASFAGTPAASPAPAPTPGQHTAEILSELGLGSREPD